MPVVLAHGKELIWNGVPTFWVDPKIFISFQMLDYVHSPHGYTSEKSENFDDLMDIESRSRTVTVMVKSMKWQTCTI